MQKLCTTKPFFFWGVAVGQVSGILCSFAATPATSHLLLQRENGIVFYVFAYAKMHMNGVEKGGEKSLEKWQGGLGNG